MSQQMEEYGEQHGLGHGWEDGIHGSQKMPRPDQGLSLFDSDYQKGYLRAYEEAYENAFGHCERALALREDVLERQELQRENDLEDRER